MLHFPSGTVSSVSNRLPELVVDHVEPAALGAGPGLSLFAVLEQWFVVVGAQDERQAIEVDSQRV